MHQIFINQFGLGGGIGFSPVAFFLKLGNNRQVECLFAS